MNIMFAMADAAEKSDVTGGWQFVIVIAIFVVGFVSWMHGSWPWQNIINFNHEHYDCKCKRKRRNEDEDED